jgi:hypothetical protein
MRRNYNIRMNSIAPAANNSVTMQHDGRIIAVQFTGSFMITLGAGDYYTGELEVSQQATAIGSTSINPPSPIIAIAGFNAAADIAGTSDVMGAPINSLVPVDWRFQVGQLTYVHVVTIAVRAGATGVFAGNVILHCETRT